MRFARKIFIAVFLTTLALGTILIWVGHNYVARQTQEDFIARYSTLSKVMSDTLTRLDTSSEAHMLNAVKVLSERDKQHGLLSTQALKSMRDELNVTHIFVVDKTGRFVRSTNEDPSLIPNVYSFCDDYRKLIAGTSDIEATPIIQPQPEPKPYKFLFIPNHNRERLLEVGVRVDFVAKTLKETLGSDSNIVSMSLYSPDGNSFARFNSKDFEFKTGKESLPSKFPTVIDSGNLLHVFTKVTSSHPKCCQCDVSGTSRNGEYFYILETEVSKKEVAAILANTQNIFFLLGFANLIFAYVLSRILARRLVRNIRHAVERVRQITSSGRLDERIKLSGKDEVSFLTNEFDKMLDSVQESQKQVIEAEKIQAKVQIAKEVAHNIKSPIIAIEMMAPMLSRLPERLQKVLCDSVREIKILADRLSRQAEIGASISGEVVKFYDLVEGGVHKKRIEYSNVDGFQIEYLERTRFEEIFIKLDPVEFQSVLSNLINNAAESYEDKRGKIKITAFSGHSNCGVEIEDQGKGIPSEIIQHIGQKSITFQKEAGEGVGLWHAHRIVKTWSGQIDIKSELNVGTIVRVTLPRYFDFVKPITVERQSVSDSIFTTYTRE